MQPLNVRKRLMDGRFRSSAGDALELFGNGAWQELEHKGRNNTI
ncbi:MAG TPA: hypothetical protein VEV82_10220 [Actinomycetota bacterium]|nr:hypothetical protein [Actinomycetota bacterium]